MSELYYSNKDMVGKLTNLEAENKSLIIRIADLSKQIVTDTVSASVKQIVIVDVCVWCGLILF